MSAPDLCFVILTRDVASDGNYVPLSVALAAKKAGMVVRTLHLDQATLRYALAVGLPADTLRHGLGVEAGLQVWGHCVGSPVPLWSMSYPNQKRARLFRYDPAAGSDWLDGFAFSVCVEPTWDISDLGMGRRVDQTANPVLIRDYEDLERPCPAPLNDLRAITPGVHSSKSFSYRVFYECISYGLPMPPEATLEPEPPGGIGDQAWRTAQGAHLVPRETSLQEYNNGAKEAALMLATVL